MSRKQSNKEIFESVPVPKAIAAMAVPTVVSQLINLIYSIVDTFFIGRTGNSYMVAAVTVTFTIYMMMVAFSNLFGVGGGSLMARLIGRDDQQNARRVSAFSFYCVIAAALLYSLLLGCFLDPILRFLGASPETIGFARQYVLLVVIIGNAPTILSMAVAHLLRNVGYSRQASLGLSGGGILNIILDPIFMFVLMPKGWEVFGAALATLISNIASCIYMLIMMKKLSGATPLSMSFREMRMIRKEDVKALFAVGIPASILTTLFDLANIVLNALMAAHGDLPLAAVGIVMKAERLPNAINIGLCQGMLPIVAYNYASGDHARMRNVIKTARNVGLIISCASIVIFEVLASPIVRVFLSTTVGNAAQSLVTIGFAVTFLRIRCLASPFQFLNYHSSFSMQAMGDGTGTLLHAVVREIVFYIPFMFLLNGLFGQLGLVSALVLGELAGAVFAILLLRFRMKRRLPKIA